MDPFILVKFAKIDAKDKDPLVSLVIFEWRDENLIGRYRDENNKVFCQSFVNTGKMKR